MFKDNDGIDELLEEWFNGGDDSLIDEWWTCKLLQKDPESKRNFKKLIDRLEAERNEQR